MYSRESNMEWLQKVKHKKKHIRLPMETTTWKTKNQSILENLKKYEERAYCKECGNIETMDHILFECLTEAREVERSRITMEPQQNWKKRIHPNTILKRGLERQKRQKYSKRHTYQINTKVVPKTTT